MKIVSCLGFAAYWGDDMRPDILEAETGKTVGGGEEAGLRTATELAAQGHDVHLFWCGLPGEWRGVKFHSMGHPLSKFILEFEPDVIIGWSTILPFQWAPKGCLRLFAQQLNDLFCPGDWSTVDCIVSPSASHARQLPGWGWKGPSTVVHNGLDPELYDVVWKSVLPHNEPLPYGEPQPKWADRPFNVGHWSSPDRGLHHLLAAWPEVVKLEPRARLHLFYEIDKWLGFAPECPGALGDRARLMRRELVPRAKADPTITFHGQVPRKVLAKVQVNCRVHCYPYQPPQYCEGFGGAVNQGIAAGCHVLLTPYDAFPDLYDGAVTWLDKDPILMQRGLAQNIVDALTDEEWSTHVTECAKPHRTKFTWENAGKEMARAVAGTWDFPNGAE